MKLYHHLANKKNQPNAEVGFLGEETTGIGFSGDSNAIFLPKEDHSNWAG